MILNHSRTNDHLNKLFLYGDIGGTKTLLQLAEVSNRQVRVHCKRHYESRLFATFPEILREFLGQAGMNSQPLAACFAVAGPVVAQQAQLTNLPWQVGSNDISRDFSIPSVKLINDFEAAALAIESLMPSDLVTLQTGEPHAQAMRVVLGAGTGMGVAWLSWSNGGYFAIPSEAGHMDFAPAGPVQMKLFEALHRKLGHVSVERLLSGAGLTNIFKFLQATATVSSNLAPINLEDDSGATITALALTHRHPVAIASLNLFAEIYGAYAGNLALAGLCRGGVYIAGGIAPRIIDYLSAGGFMRAFRDKGRFAPLLHEIPVHVINNPEIGLLGAKREAQHLLGALGFPVPDLSN